ncbi:MAG: hypothetical protein AB7E27_05200 [Candidatus Methanomethylophilaceae archaeon]|jgi:hypothetical protein
MVFGKKKNEEKFIYDLDAHSDKPVYLSRESETSSGKDSISELPDHLLIAELEFRGYTVGKK